MHLTTYILDLISKYYYKITSRLLCSASTITSKPLILWKIIEHIASTYTKLSMVNPRIFYHNFTNPLKNSRQANSRQNYSLQNTRFYSLEIRSGDPEDCWRFKTPENNILNVHFGQQIIQQVKPRLIYNQMIVNPDSAQSGYHCQGQHILLIGKFPQDTDGESLPLFCKGSSTEYLEWELQDLDPAISLHCQSISPHLNLLITCQFLSHRFLSLHPISLYSVSPKVPIQKIICPFPLTDAA